MSAQMYDRIVYENKEYGLAATPLEEYFRQHPERRPQFSGFNSACMRGYLGLWEIRDNKLYLAGMEMVVPTEATFASLFPEAGEEGIFADWVSGDLRCPHGKVIRPDHAAFETVWEFELLLTFEAGVLLAAENRINAI